MASVTIDFPSSSTAGVLAPMGMPEIISLVSDDEQ
jgi:hypothetical protein